MYCGWCVRGVGWANWGAEKLAWELAPPTCSRQEAAPQCHTQLIAHKNEEIVNSLTLNICVQSFNTPSSDLFHRSNRGILNNFTPSPFSIQSRPHKLIEGDPIYYCQIFLALCKIHSLALRRATHAAFL